MFASATLALRQALAAPLDAAEHAVVAAATRQLFERGAASVVDGLVAHLLGPLRGSRRRRPRGCCATPAPTPRHRPFTPPGLTW